MANRYLRAESVDAYIESTAGATERRVRVSLGPARTCSQLWTQAVLARQLPRGGEPPHWEVLRTRPHR